MDAGEARGRRLLEEWRVANGEWRVRSGEHDWPPIGVERISPSEVERRSPSEVEGRYTFHHQPRFTSGCEMWGIEANG
jgi:hypothetical protein